MDFDDVLEAHRPKNF